MPDTEQSQIFEAAEIPAAAGRAIIAIRAKGDRISSQPLVEVGPKIALTIGKCIQDYWGIETAAYASAIRQCQNTVCNYYGDMSVEEIPIAFSLYFKDGGPSSYGKFAVKDFTPIMAKYREYKNRLQVAAQVAADQEAEQKEAEHKRLKNQAANESIAAEFTRMIIDGECFETFDQVPAFWAEILVSKRLIDGDAQTWITAKRQVVDEFLKRTELMEPTLIVGDIISCRNLKKRIDQNPEIFPKELDPVARVRYGKLLIHQALKTNAANFQNNE